MSSSSFIDKDKAIELIVAAFKEEFAHLKENFTPEQQRVFKESLIGYANERIAMAMASDEGEKARRRKNLEHYESAMKSCAGITQIKSYDSAISLSGRILAGILLATGNALIP
jgi:hypothetical protein